jgi:2,3-bisphosphoglycerate-independent phosphoglycerate mutase
MKGHSWHEVPCLIHSKWCRPDRLAKFSETMCRQGSLGHLPAPQLMPLAMAHALKLTKYGA